MKDPILIKALELRQELKWKVIDSNNAHFIPAHFNSLKDAQEFINNQLHDELNQWAVIKDITS